MKTIYKQSLAALFAAAVALGCGSSDKQQQQAKAPSSPSMQTSSLETTSATTTQGMNTSAPPPTSLQTTQTTQTPQQPATNAGPQDTGRTSTDSQNAEPSGSTTTTSATLDTNVTTLSDGEVFAIESAINKGEISLAEMARKKAASGEVKNFASMALTHHRDAQNKANAISKKEKIVAKDDDASRKLQNDVTATTGDLQNRKGRDFDSSYIDSQVRMHRDAGTLIDSQLLPSVKSAALKDELTSLRQTISNHLTKAEEIQSHLEAVGTTTTSGATIPAGKAKTGTKAKGGTTTPKQQPQQHDTQQPTKPN